MGTNFNIFDFGYDTMQPQEVRRCISAILIHGAGLYTAYLLIYLLNGWLKQQLLPIAIFIAVFIAGYVVIWLIIYSVTKIETEALNKKLRETP